MLHRVDRLPSLLLTLFSISCSGQEAGRDAGPPPSAAEAASPTEGGSPAPGADAAPDAGAEPDAEAAPPARELIVAASGDVMIHGKVLESAQGHEGRFRYVLADLGAALSELEQGPGGARREVLTLVNLETLLSMDYVDPYNANPPVLGSPPELAADLAAVGVDVVTVANNHALDQTADGLVDTLRVARQAGLGAVGAGETVEASLSPWTIERGGLRVGVLGATDHVNGGPSRTAKAVMHIPLLREEEPLLEAIARLRGEVDLVVVAVHWSSDFSRQPVASQRQLARRLVEAGADLILGSGPHVPHEVERLPSPRGEALVAYSLGNLVSNQGLRYQAGHRVRPDEHPVAITPGTRDSVLLAVRVRSPERGRVELAAVEGHLLWTSNNFWERRNRDDVSTDIRLTRLRDVEPALRAEREAALAEVLGPAVTLLP